MLQLNLFHEQQRIQLEKDLDPVRLTIVAGGIVTLIILVWSLTIYFNLSPLRKELADVKDSVSKKEKLFKSLENQGGLTDFPKIQSQAQSLQNQMEYRTLFATQLDVYRDLIPTNCQVKAFSTSRSLRVSETTQSAGRKGGTIVTKTSAPTLEIVLSIRTQAKTKVDLLQIRDQLIDVFRQNQRLQQYAEQELSDNSTNKWNRIVLTPGSAVFNDPKLGEMALGDFELKIPLKLKDPSKEM